MSKKVELKVKDSIRIVFVKMPIKIMVDIYKPKKVKCKLNYKLQRGKRRTNNTPN